MKYEMDTKFLKVWIYLFLANNLLSANGFKILLPVKRNTMACEKPQIGESPPGQNINNHQNTKENYVDQSGFDWSQNGPKNLDQCIAGGRGAGTDPADDRENIQGGRQIPGNPDLEVPVGSKTPSGNTNGGTSSECLSNGNANNDKDSTISPETPGGNGNIDEPENKPDDNPKTEKNIENNCYPGLRARNQPIPEDKEEADDESDQDNKEDYVVIQHHRHSPHKYNKKQQSSEQSSVEQSAQQSPPQPSVQEQPPQGYVIPQTPQKAFFQYTPQQAPAPQTPQQPFVQQPSQQAPVPQIPQQPFVQQWSQQALVPQTPQQPFIQYPPQQALVPQTPQQLLFVQQSPQELHVPQNPEAVEQKRYQHPEFAQASVEQTEMPSAEASEEEEFSRRFLQRILQESRKNKQFLDKNISNESADRLRYEDHETNALNKRSFPSNVNDQRVIYQHDVYTEKRRPPGQWSEKILLEKLLIAN